MVGEVDKEIQVNFDKKAKNMRRDDGDGINYVNWFLVVSGALSLIAYGLIIYIYYKQFGIRIGEQRADWGTFGDFIGGTINPLFSFMSFLGLLYAVSLQRKELLRAERSLEEEREAQRRSLIQSRNDERRIEVETALKSVSEEIESIFLMPHQFENIYHILDNIALVSPEKVTYGDFFSNISLSGSFDLIPENVKHHWSKGTSNAAINRLTVLVLDMGAFLSSYVGLVGETPLSMYYKKKYRRTVDVLQEKKYINPHTLTYYDVPIYWFNRRVTDLEEK